MSDILIYQTQDGRTQIQVQLTDHTVWLTQADMVELFQSSKSNISEHIKHVFEEGELIPEATVRKFRTVELKEIFLGTGKITSEGVLSHLVEWGVFFATNTYKIRTSF